MIRTRLRFATVLTLYIFCITACLKKDFPDKKDDSPYYIPNTLDGLMSLLENDLLLSQTPALSMISADQMYFTDRFSKMIPYNDLHAHTWSDTVFITGESVKDWDLTYQQVFCTNIVLEGINNIPADSANRQLYNLIKGTALFIRSYAFYNLAQVFALPYDPLTADETLGIPLRLTSDLTERSVRATIEQTYDQIIAGLREAMPLLSPVPDRGHLNQPSAPAALAMLARVYLSMGKYDKALACADSCLRMYPTLIDYNKINNTAIFPFAFNNEETLYQSSILTGSSLIAGFAAQECFIDSNLFRSYEPGDLRPAVFFRKTPQNMPVIKGSYYGKIYPFTGLATDEVYLIRAECYARAGNVPAAMADLNTLLRNRWNTNNFIPLSATTHSEALTLVLKERYKELVLRGQRWTDIRRLNKEGAGIILTRKLAGVSYQLLPNHHKYALPIPDMVIRMSGMPQNPR